MPASELIAKTATEIVTLLKAGEVSSLDLLDALEARIAEVEPAVNALPTLCLDRARDAAKALTAKPVAERGVLAGMPVAIKDLLNVAGVRSTQGSPIFADTVPETSRSEEHTSELQSLMRISYAVFCLKKKNKKQK